MILRLTLAPTLALGLLASLPVAAQAQQDKAAACANSAAIVMRAVEGRKQGVAKSRARAALRGGWALARGLGARARGPAVRPPLPLRPPRPPPRPPRPPSPSPARARAPATRPAPAGKGEDESRC